MTKADGSKYEGRLVFSKPNGQGTDAFTDGSKYDGEWRNVFVWNVTKFDKNENLKGTIVNG